MAARPDAWPPPAAGAVIVHDRYAWIRAVCSEDGPDSIVRHVLMVMATAMNPDGSRCTLGARRLAIATGYVKDTVARARLRAVESGWLWPPSHAKGARCVEWRPSVPAGIELTILRAPAVSDPIGHSAPSRVSDLTGSSVRYDTRECPTRSDKPLLPHQYHSEGAGAPLEQRRLRLLSIIADPRNRQHYRTAEDMALAIPPDIRFRGYEQEIESAWEASA